MCGIFASISRRENPPLSQPLRDCLVNRGPDHIGNVQKIVGQGDHTGLYLTCIATVLSLRGHGITEQPLVGPATDSILCWNGEAWTIDGRSVTGNDGAAVLRALDVAVGHEGILDVFRAVQGPFAFIYYDPRGGRIYFARDRLGRRSLLVHDEDDFLLSSVADPTVTGWKEVEADGVYVVDVKGLGDARPRNITMHTAERHGWLPEGQEEYVSCGDLCHGLVGIVTYHEAKMSNIGIFNTALPVEGCPPLQPGSKSVQALREHLIRSLSLRVLNVPQPPLDPEQTVETRVAILFSGGLDCTVLARLASELLPEDQGIDLINVAFENPRIAARLPADRSPTAIYEVCPDRITGRKSFSELCNVCPRRQWRFISVSYRVCSSGLKRAS